MNRNEAWQIWRRKPEVEETLALRAKGDLPEMESTKQVVKLVAEVYKPGMKILDVGCNAGHYLRGLRRIDKNLSYVGVDPYDAYIKKAKEYFANDSNAKFLIGDVMQPLFPDSPFDIVICCNVLLHLPYFKIPVKNLIQAAKKYCFIRTLLGDLTTLVKLVNENDFTKEGEPLDFYYQNTYQTGFFLDYIKSFDVKVELIDDEFDSNVLSDEYRTVKRGFGTRMVGGAQAVGNILYNWKFVKITK